MNHRRPVTLVAAWLAVILSAVALLLILTADGVSRLSIVVGVFVAAVSTWILVREIKSRGRTGTGVD